MGRVALTAWANNSYPQMLLPRPRASVDIPFQAELLMQTYQEWISSHTNELLKDDCCVMEQNSHGVQQHVLVHMGMLDLEPSVLNQSTNLTTLT